MLLLRAGLNLPVTSITHQDVLDVHLQECLQWSDELSLGFLLEPLLRGTDLVLHLATASKVAPCITRKV